MLFTAIRPRMNAAGFGAATFAAAFATGVAALAPPASAQAYPTKPIRIIVPFAPGGGTDNAARMIGQRMTENWGQPVVIENRPGGNTVIGSEAMVKSAPDGYTFLFMNTSHTINPAIMRRLPYDPVRDFTPVTSVMNNYFMLILHSSVPAGDLGQTIALIKSHPPGGWHYASVGTAGVGRLAAESFSALAGVKMTNVPYKGTSQLLADLLSGQVKFTIELPGLYIPHIKSGKLKGIAVTGRQRLKSLPDVPTFAETGMPGMDIRSWYGIMAPAKTPQAVVSKVAGEVARIMQLPETRERLAAIEAAPFISTPEEFAAFVKSEMAKFAAIVKAAGIPPEN